MRPTRIEIAGFKGAAPVAYDLTSQLVFITGRNGQGKSRIREALDFVLGRDVAGVSGAGKELRAALAGAELDVTLTLDLGDGATQTVRRSRRIEKGTFKKPQVFIGGVEADDTKLAELLGDVSAPAGSTWLELSEDKLLAELARLGARARSGRGAVLSAVRAVAAHNKGALAEALCTALGVKTPPRFVPPEDAPEELVNAGYAARAGDVLIGLENCASDRLLATARDVAKAEVNEAQRAFKAIESSADRSREVSVAAEVRPDEVALVEAQVKAANEAFRTADAERVTAKNALEAGARPLAEWEATKARLDAKVSAARTSLGALPVPPVEAKAALDDAPLRATLAAAVAYANDVAGERDAAAKAEQAALFAWGTAENTTKSARAALKVLDGGHCPTCRQAITGDVRAVFDRALTDAEQAEARAKSELDAARAYLQDQRTELDAANRDVDKARSALDAALKTQAAAGVMAKTRETYNAAARALDEALAEQTAFLAKPAPAQPSDARARYDVAVADADAKFVEMDRLRARLTEVSGQVERYKRWRSDLKLRTDAEGRKKAADALMESVRTAERDLAKAGTDELLGTAAMYLPPEFGAPLVFDGAIGISQGVTFWSGPGLSNAQKLVLSIAIDRALDTINGRRLRLVLVEAEALDDATLDHVAAALEGDVEMGALDCAMLISCHDPPRLVPQWQRIHVGPPSPVRPGGGEPAPIVSGPGAEYGRSAIETAVDALAETVGYVPGVGHVSALDLVLRGIDSDGNPVTETVDLDIATKVRNLKQRMSDAGDRHDLDTVREIQAEIDALEGVVDEPNPYNVQEVDNGDNFVATFDMPMPAEPAPSVIERVVANHDGGMKLADAVDAAIFGPEAVAAIGQDGVDMALALSGMLPDADLAAVLDDTNAAPHAMSPAGAEVLASIVEADIDDLTPEELAYAKSLAADGVDATLNGVPVADIVAAQAEFPLDGVAPKNPPPAPALLPDPMNLDDAGAISALASVGLPTDGMSPQGARGILARRLASDCPPSVVEATANAIRKHLPKAPARGVADWIWRPGQTLGENPSRETLDAVINHLSARAVNELRTWPGSERKPFAGGEMDAAVLEELTHELLVLDEGYPPRLTPAGVKAWEVLHDVAPVQSDAQAERTAPTALAMLDGAGVTADEARVAIKGMQADALKALGEECVDLSKTANMTIGKRRDEIAARLSRAGTALAALADMVAKYNAAHPPAPKRLTKGATSGDGAPDETNEVGAAVAPEGE